MHVSFTQYIWRYLLWINLQFECFVDIFGKVCMCIYILTIESDQTLFEVLLFLWIKKTPVFECCWCNFVNNLCYLGSLVLLVGTGGDVEVLIWLNNQRSTTCLFFMILMTSSKARRVGTLDNRWYTVDSKIKQ